MNDLLFGSCNGLGRLMGKKTAKADQEAFSTIWQRFPRLQRLLKTMAALIAALGIVAAGIGYLTGSVQFVVELRDRLLGYSEVHIRINEADELLAHRDYRAAWEENASALKLDPTNASAAAQQAQIAMKWLEDLRVDVTRGPQPYSTLIDPLKAVLIERVAHVQGVAKADLHAHIGWANLVLFQDGQPQTDVIEEFNTAISEDPDNVYGHVMRGFWSLRRGEPIDTARADFDIAMRQTKDHAFSDSVIMDGFTHVMTDEFNVAAIEYADAIRRSGRDIADDTKDKLIWYYDMSLHDADLLEKISKALPPGEQTLFLDWLRNARTNESEKRTASYFAAYFAALNGQKADAMQRYNQLLSTLPAKGKENYIIYPYLQKALAQLKK